MLPPDMIWAPTSYLAAAYAPVSPIPVIPAPHVLQPKQNGHRQQGRRRLGLHAGEFTYAFAFNFHNCFERKNPLAVIDSFKAAFRPDEPARLIVKCVNADYSPGHFSEIQRRAAG